MLYWIFTGFLMLLMMVGVGLGIYNIIGYSVLCVYFICLLMIYWLFKPAFMYYEYFGSLPSFKMIMPDPNKLFKF